MTVPKFLLWLDFETSSLPVHNDYSHVHILEVGAILTDMGLARFGGYHEVIQMTEPARAQLLLNDYIRNLHKESGLLADSVKSIVSVREAEDELLTLLQEAEIKPGEVSLAGSGVAAFDHNVIKEHMPRLAAYLTYFSYDIGTFHRMFKILYPHKDLINPSSSSFGANKLHRAWADVVAHYELAKEYMDAMTQHFEQS